MSNRCQDMRPLLAAMAYDEVDAAERATVDAHLEGCADCRERLAAYGAVRSNLQAWQPEAAPSGIRFIAPPKAERAGILHSPWLRGLAVAASFVFGLVLTAAIVNLQLIYSDSGWTLSTSLGADRAKPAVPRGPDSEAGAAAPAAATSVPRADLDAGPTMRRVAFEQLDRAALSAWLDQELRSRDIRPVEPVAHERLTEEQLAQVRDAIAARLLEFGEEQTLQFGNMIAASEMRQLETFRSTVAGMMTDIEAQHRDDLFMLASELGLAQGYTDQKIQNVNSAIDYLMSQVAARNEPPQER